MLLRADFEPPLFKNNERKLDISCFIPHQFSRILSIFSIFILSQDCTIQYQIVKN